MSSTLEVGDQIFLRLDGFDPGWRQALVVVSHRKRNKLVCAVRVLDQEIADIVDQVTFFEQGGNKYILVEGHREQLRKTCSQPHRALELRADLLLAASQEVLERDSLLYLTASEDAEDTAPKVKGQLKQADLSSEDSSDPEVSEDDPVFQLLNKASKTRRGTGIASGSKERATPKERFPLLKGESSQETDAPDLNQLVAQALAAGNSGSSTAGLNTLVSLELLKAIKGKGKPRKTSLLRKDDEDSDQSSSDDDQDEVKLTGAGKALKNYRRGHKMMQKRPLRHIRRYIEEIEAIMGVNSQIPYRISDYTKKINWGKQKSLMRIHFALSELLESLLKGKNNIAGLQAVQLRRAVHQCSLDQGSWKAASLLLAHQDPLERPRFGGEPDQLEKIASYLKAMDDLEKRSRMSQPSPEVDTSKKQKGKGKGKKAEATEDADVWAVRRMNHQRSLKRFLCWS